MIVSSKAEYTFKILINAYDSISVKIEVEDSFVTIKTNGLQTTVKTSGMVSNAIVGLDSRIDMVSASVIASKIK